MSKVYIFGDESGAIGGDRFFAVGILGTREPNTVVEILREIRKKTNYFGEVSYKGKDKKRILCAIRWVDWFFSNQEIIHFKMVLKDSEEFKIRYFRDNAWATDGKHLAYCETYREVLGNFADYNNDIKYLIYSQIGMSKISLDKYLNTRVSNLDKAHCFSRHTKEKNKANTQYTGSAELLQLADLLTSSTRGLCRAVHGSEVESMDKNILRKNIAYQVSGIEDKFRNRQSLYYPQFNPYSNQKFVIYRWRPNK